MTIKITITHGSGNWLRDAEREDVELIRVDGDIRVHVKNGVYYFVEEDDEWYERRRKRSLL